MFYLNSYLFSRNYKIISFPRKKKKRQLPFFMSEMDFHKNVIGSPQKSQLIQIIAKVQGWNMSEIHLNKV